MNIKNIPIGEVLKEYGYITEEQLQEALKAQKEQKGKRLGDLLIEMGFITERQKLQALAERLTLRLTDLSGVQAELEAVEMIPRALAEKYNILAIRKSEHYLTVVTDEPMNFYGLEDIRQLVGKDLEILLAEKAPVARAIEYYYAEVEARAATRNANTSMKEEVEEIELEEGEGDAPIIKLLSSLIQRAYSTHASDIHIEPFETKTLVRMRIDGTIVEYVTLQRSVHASLIARMKILADLDIAERRIPQDGHFRTKIESEMINIRVSVIPTVFGEKAVLRLLASNGAIDHADAFGMNETDYMKFRKMLKSPNGIIYLTGPTGSGKSTTLYMVLEELAKGQVNISTIEDPVEKNVAKINQMQVNNMAGLTFETGLRALLRQDPDIIMVGETRDAETASISIRAAITGHLVLSTLHTNNAISSIVRLIDMGMEPYMIANSLVGVVAQRLMRKVCPHCCREAETTPDERKILGEEIMTVKKAVGCNRCNFTGYNGRVAIHEIVNIDDEIRQMITNRASMAEITEYAVRTQDMKSLKQAGQELVRAGITTMDELVKIAYYS
nr:GspE/PulE family protein [Murimonas intestini]